MVIYIGNIQNQVQEVMAVIDDMYIDLKEYIELWWFNDYKVPKIILLISQVIDRRPINNPIQGRCY